MSLCLPGKRPLGVVAFILNASFMMGMGVLFFGGVGIILDVILLLVIATGDKRLFQASAVRRQFGPGETRRVR